MQNAVRVTNDFDINGFKTAVKCSEDLAKTHEWCFNCRGEPHAPAGCKEVVMWKKKCQVHAQSAEISTTSQRFDCVLMR